MSDTQGVLGLSLRADDASVARVARRFAAAYVAAEEGAYSQAGLHLLADRDAALADLLLVTGHYDAYEGVEHDDRPEALVEVNPKVL